jgi:hypothetical protein
VKLVPNERVSACKYVDEGETKLSRRRAAIRLVPAADGRMKAE